ncbi:hypothetical protein [Roseivivax lentus]|uniref:hypothetical protein n=1 Tax=Roseivivax lentus TaxID=633194 RepID=UPI00117B182E|nr:hypothetical protein [Roseivivax lentus]
MTDLENAVAMWLDAVWPGRGWQADSAQRLASFLPAAVVLGYFRLRASINKLERKDIFDTCEQSEAQATACDYEEAHERLCILEFPIMRLRPDPQAVRRTPPWDISQSAISIATYEHY